MALPARGVAVLPPALLAPLLCFGPFLPSPQVFWKEMFSAMKLHSTRSLAVGVVSSCLVVSRVLYRYINIKSRNVLSWKAPTRIHSFLQYLETPVMYEPVFNTKSRNILSLSSKIRSIMESRLLKGSKAMCQRWSNPSRHSWVCWH